MIKVNSKIMKIFTELYFQEKYCLEICPDFIKSVPDQAEQDRMETEGIKIKQHKSIGICVV